MKRLFPFFLLWAFCSAMSAQRSFVLPNSEDGQSTLHVFLPAESRATGRAVVDCPGGGYGMVCMDYEGTDWAPYYNDLGIAYFVLKYRMPKGDRTIPVSDAEHAIRLVRDSAQQWHINPYDIGIMGFSAGGHLAMASGEYFNTDYAGLGWLESRRPDFVVPVYPVVTFTDKRYMHKRSRKGLIGEWHTKEMNDSLSIEHHVKYDTPCAFIVNCVDDPIVKYQNSELLDSALTAKGIEHRYIQYKTGGHGFGASDEKGTEECRQWRGEFLEWLKSSGRAR